MSEAIWFYLVDEIAVKPVRNKSGMHSGPSGRCCLSLRGAGGVLSRSRDRVGPFSPELSDEDNTAASRALVDGIFSAIDHNHNGALELDELTAVLLTNACFTHARVVELFLALDKNKDFRLTQDEFQRVSARFRDELRREVNISIELSSRICFCGGDAFMPAKVVDNFYTEYDERTLIISLHDVNGAIVQVGHIKPCKVQKQLSVTLSHRSLLDPSAFNLVDSKDVESAMELTNAAGQKLVEDTSIQRTADGFTEIRQRKMVVKASVMEEGENEEIFALYLAPQFTTVIPGSQVFSCDGSPFCGTVIQHDFLGHLWCLKDNSDEVVRFHYDDPELQRMHYKHVDSMPDQPYCWARLKPADEPHDHLGRKDSRTITFMLPPVAYEQGQSLAIASTTLLANHVIVTRSEGNGRHVLSGSDGNSFTLDLNLFNHCRWGFDSVEQFRCAVMSYCEQLYSETEHLEDGITGIKLKTEDQTIDIEVESRGLQRRGFSDIASIQDLAEPLLETTPTSHGCHLVLPVLVHAGPGTGKTWSMVKLSHKLARLCKQQCTSGIVLFVPVLVYVSRLARILQERSKEAKIDSSILVQYFVREYGMANATQAGWLMVLAQALQMRKLIVILDGINEAAGSKAAVSEFVREVLVPQGFRIVCSSRPEGVKLEDFSRFVTFNLRPLSVVSQHNAITRQLNRGKLVSQQPRPGDVTSNGITEHLMALLEIQINHDRLYVQDAFNEEQRRAIETFRVRDRLLLADGKTSNPEMRQRAKDGSYVCESIQLSPASDYLQGTALFMTEATLKHLDDGLSSLEGNPKTALQTIVCKLSDPGVVDHQEECGFLLVKLGLLVRNRQQKLGKSDRELERKAEEGDTIALKELNHREKLRAMVPEVTALTLWPRIVARTDQIYQMAEVMRPKFEGALNVICTLLGQVTVGRRRCAAAEVVFGALKDPVRIHEKALDDYFLDFDDWERNCVVPEACVLDILRCRVVCPDGHSMQRLLEALAEDKTTRGVAFMLICANNTFASHSVNSTHCRNVILNFQLAASDGYRMQSTYAEVQVHHLAILKYNDDSCASDHYDFFRSLVAANYGPGLDTMLVRVLEFLKGAASVPLLLSMLVLIFKHHQEGDSPPLPVNLFELYQQALALKMATASTEAVLRALAWANQRDLRREFTSTDVADALAPEDQAHWKELVQEGTLPLVKVLENDAISTKRGDGLFQFKHLALQEALAAQVLVAHPTKLVPQWDGGEQASETLMQAFHLSMLCIGGGRLGAALGGSEWKFEQRLGSLRQEGWQAVMSLLCGNKVLTTLDLRRNGLGPEGAKVLVPGLISSAFTAIGQGGLNLKYNQVGDEGWSSIFSDICGSKTGKMTLIDVSNERISPSGAKLIAKALRESVRGSLPEVSLDGFALPVDKLKGTDPVEALDLSGKSLGIASAIVIAALIGINGKLNSLSLAENELGDEGAVALSIGLKENRSLVTLDVRGKGYGNGCIGSRGAAALASAIAVMGVLTKCEIRQNNLGVEGWTSIFNALRDRPTSRITEWNLSSEGLGPAIAKPLAEYLSVTSVLIKCEIRGNQLGVTGWTTIFNALRGSPISKIATWDLSDEWLGPEITKPLAEYISVADALKQLDVQLNLIGDEEKAALQKAVAGRSGFELKLTSFELPLATPPRAATAPAFSLREPRF